MKLVVVESPTKARTISQFLGEDFVVESSVGHIRDLPRNAADVPESYKGQKWARLGVDTENDFKALYIVPQDKKKQVTKLKKLLKEADELYLATDEDREGESIAWHLLEVLNPKKMEVKRMVFHEITPAAIEHALEATRDLDRRLVDAQEARRILDRLFGYEVSPVLWKKVKPRLSAGRVQSPSVRIIVQRERERMAFNSASYWDIEGVFTTDDAKAPKMGATLVSVDGTRVASGKDFGASGESKGKDVLVFDEVGANELATSLSGVDFSVRSIESKPYSRSPSPPFRTSTLQQEAGRKLRFTSRRTMQVAQRLYEQGYITYMRTDSINLSDAAIASARSLAVSLYGAEFVPDQPRVWKGKVKNAQEAHEAIRPAGDSFRTPDAVKKEVSVEEAKLYDLIWKRTVASEMKDAKGESVKVLLGAIAKDRRNAEFAASGKIISFPGFMRAYVEGADDPDAELEDQERRLPLMKEGDPLNVLELEPKGHETKPPARYTEATLIKRLEELGIGRPSTYASIISTVQDRGYVWKKGSALVPSFTAFATVALLEQHFPDLVDYAFTAKMEEELDEIANGEKEYIPYLSAFYFGNGTPGLKSMVDKRLEEIDAKAINSIPLGKNQDGVEILARVGRYGPYLQRGEDTVSIAEDVAPDELNAEIAEELLNAPSGDRELGKDPETGEPVLVKTGRYGPYVQLGTPEPGGKEKPKTASLFKTMAVDTVTFEEALKLLTQPVVVGTDAESGDEVTAQNGRYGPYLKKGTDSRSLEEEEQIFTITMAEADALFAQPKRRRGRASAALRELGVDPITDKPVVVKDGRYGPYVTDGETNASLRAADTVEEVNLERASELLQARREKVEGMPPKPKKAAKKKAPAKKKAAAKKEAPAKKAPAAKKKETAKKSAPAKKKLTAAEKAPATKAEKEDKSPASD
ncbi:MAG: type I DNA topoisomerase [Acidimicrobiia bacterium]|nr:type I DNA topoisomerase [Acidimicrobiia bacterium]